MIRCAHTQICHVENSLEGPVDSKRDFLHYYRLVMGDENISIIHCIQLCDSWLPLYDFFNENLSFYLFVDNPPMYISIRSSPTIDIMCGLPSDVYQLGRLRRLIFSIWTTLRSLLFLDNPPNHSLKNYLMHSLLSS